jgi:hypothetical protein
VWYAITRTAEFIIDIAAKCQTELKFSQELEVLGAEFAVSRAAHGQT